MNTPVAAATPNPVQTARVLLKELQEKYAVFRDYLPLAIGIDKQLIALSPDTNRKTLRIALGMHTNSLRYLKGMEKATHRFDLEGNSTDEVTEVHRTHATETLRERFKKNAEQRKLQRAAEAAQQAAEKAAAQHAEKLNQLTAKFSRNR
ncbi:ProQ/FINO family protein [Collimonas pratensis]|uniref:ProQ/FINO family protein n=1 Tax=Collimonas pratensis TaxID=279113 RepID=A0A127PYV1_9BURK|nr:ProQ/FinO family protein [Collimonas pratensis]AMP02552.1 proQ/FINO family protein [Collimonas pratensis]AMP12453.1 proQ/FINO family protein [Collimonas pratensis]